MNDYLEHHGVLGQKWGVRRYQNSDGSLTSEGKSHYGQSSNKSIKAKGEPRRYELTDEQKVKVKKALKVGAIAVGAGLAAYGTYKVSTINPAFSSNPQLANMVVRGRDSLKTNLNIASIKAVNGAKRTTENAKEAVKSSVKNTAKNAMTNLKNNAMDVAITSLSVAALKKIDEAIPENNGDKTNKVIRTTAKQTVNDATNNLRSGFKINMNSNHGNSSQPSMSQGKIESLIGSKPKGHDMVDNNTPEWGQLLNSVPKEKKQVIKDARRLGYDWNELQLLATRL